MRLIDKDALPSALFKRHVHDDEELEPMLYFEDAVKVVENAPTIDAIPVEWLVNIKNEYAMKHGIPLVRIPYSEKEAITLDLLFSDKYLVSA